MLYTFFMCVRVSVCARWCVRVSQFQLSTQSTYHYGRREDTALRTTSQHHWRMSAFPETAKIMATRELLKQARHLISSLRFLMKMRLKRMWLLLIVSTLWNVGKNVAAMRKVSLPFGLTAVFVASTCVKFGEETDHFVNQHSVVDTNTCTTSMSLTKIYLKFLKNTPTCFGHSTFIREFFSSSLKSLLSTTLWIFLY